MSKVFGAVTGATQIQEGTQRAAEAARFQDFQSLTPFGEVNINRGGLQAAGGPGSGLTGGFEGLAGQFTGEAGQLPGGGFTALDPNQAFAQAQGTGGGVAGQFLGAASPFLQGAQGFAQSLADFDPDQFASQQFERLQNIARPGEETATAGALQNLFSRGRLGGGDTASSTLLGGLQQAQTLATDQRALSAIGLAQREQQSRAGIAGQLAGTAGQLGLAGEQIGGSQLQRFLSSLGGAQQLGGFQSGLRGQTLQQALGATGGISTALQPTNQGIQNTLAASGLVNQSNIAAAGIEAQGAQAAGQATGAFTGAVIGGASNALLPRP